MLPGHAVEKQRANYKKWADTLFVKVPSDEPMLKQPVYFWAKAWQKGSVGIWKRLGPVQLAFLEILLIGVAGQAFQNRLLNREGVNRDKDQQP